MEEKIYTFSSNSLSLTEMFENVANHIFSKQSDLRKEIGEIMGGKILELESERLLRTGKEQGLIQGEEKAKLDIAKRMLERSFSLEDIQFSTGLSKKELEKLLIVILKEVVSTISLFCIKTVMLYLLYS